MEPEYSIVRDWNKLQGMTDAADSYVQIRRDLNHRYISVENSGSRPIGIAISTVICDKTPALQFVLQPNEIKQLGINEMTGPMQFIYPLNPYNGLPVGSATPCRTNANQFVLREGVQKWWVDCFFSSGFKGAFA